MTHIPQFHASNLTHTSLHTGRGRPATSVLQPQIRLHVLLVGFDARLTVRIGTDEPTFKDRGQHEHLEQLADRVFVERWKTDIRRWATVIRVGLVRAIDGCLENLRHRTSRQNIQLILIQMMSWYGHRQLAAMAWQEICDQLVATPLLMLLPALCRSRVFTTVIGVAPRSCFPSFLKAAGHTRDRQLPA